LLVAAYVALAVMLVVEFALLATDAKTLVAELGWSVSALSVPLVLVIAVSPPAQLRRRWLRRGSVELVLRSERVLTWSVDLASGETVWSPGVQRLLDLDATMRPSPALFFAHVHPEDLASVRAAYEAAVDAGATSHDLEFRLVDRHGRVVWCRSEILVVRDVTGTVTAVFGTVEDITDGKVAEEAIREQLVAQERVTEELQRVDEMKNAFLSAVSHELRTPLTVVQGLGMTLVEHRDALPPEKVDELLDRLLRNAERLATLLGDLLDLDRIRHGALDLQYREVAVAALVGRVVEDLETGGRMIGIDVGDDVTATLDVTRPVPIVAESECRRRGREPSPLPHSLLCSLATRPDGRTRGRCRPSAAQLRSAPATGPTATGGGSSSTWVRRAPTSAPSSVRFRSYVLAKTVLR
jgi:PAS domain S-box-containing protein